MPNRRISLWWDMPTKIAVVGVGYLGRHHARLLAELPGADLRFVVDRDEERARTVARDSDCAWATDYRDVLDEVDAASIVVPTPEHHHVALDFLRAGKDILLEKPITVTVEEGVELIREAQKSAAVFQVGHLERFNAGVGQVMGKFRRPTLIECQRRSPFGTRGTDVDVTLDLMIHDIDIVLTLVNSKVRSVHAAGESVVSEHLDVVSAWIDFESGCVAQVTSSRLSSERLRRLRIFERDRVLSLDFQSQIVTEKRKGTDGMVQSDEIRPPAVEPLREELKSFLECVATRRQPVVSGDDGLEALKVALRISALVKGERTTVT